MKAIVVLLMRPHNAKVQRIPRSLQRSDDSNMREMTPHSKSTSEQSTPPFWTWFVENPSRSPTSVDPGGTSGKSALQG